MKTATVKEIQAELEQLPQAGLVTLCLRLAKFKKENKELLTYLLFESFDEDAYLITVKNYIDEQFEPRLIMPISLSYDHRLIDGADAARFMKWLKEAIENPFFLMLEG